MDNKRGAPFPPVGASALMVIFAVLCLTVFALLSVSTVLSEQRLADAAEAGMVHYYKADCEAQEILARLRGGEIPDTVTCDGGVYAYTCALSDTQALEVQVWVAGEAYQILRWQVVSTTDWKAEEDLPVWAG